MNKLHSMMHLSYFSSRFLGFSLLVLVTISCGRSEKPAQVIVMSLNARYDNPADAPNDWKRRLPIIAGTILDSAPDLIGFQEILSHQLRDLDSCLTGFDHAGVGRDDGKVRGEACPVFFRSDRFEDLATGTIWLSPTPSDTGSVGWDAALPRILTWIRLRDLRVKTAKEPNEFYFLNTHFDHMGDTARLESAWLIREFIRKNTDGLPVVMTGDFNCSPADPPYNVITGEMDGKPGLNDACRLTGALEEPTFNGFGNPDAGQRIDFIFADQSWETRSYHTLMVITDGIYISDHFPIMAKMVNTLSHVP